MRATYLYTLLTYLELERELGRTGHWPLGHGLTVTYLTLLRTWHLALATDLMTGIRTETTL